MKKTALLSLLLMGSLTACDAQQAATTVAKIAPHVAPMLVIEPGYKVMIDGKPTPVMGHDECPSNPGTAVFGTDPLVGQTGCIVLSKDRTEVPVSFPGPKGMVNERWTIVRETRQGTAFPMTMLRRPDGSPIVAAK